MAESEHAQPKTRHCDTCGGLIDPDDEGNYPEQCPHCGWDASEGRFAPQCGDDDPGFTVAERRRRKALRRALHESKHVKDYVGGECNGDVLRVTLAPGKQPGQPAPSGLNTVGTIAHGLGFDVEREGALDVKLIPRGYGEP